LCFAPVPAIPTRARCGLCRWHAPPDSTPQHAVDRLLAFPQTFPCCMHISVHGWSCAAHHRTHHHHTAHAIYCHTALWRGIVTRAANSSHDRRTCCPCLPYIPRGSQGDVHVHFQPSSDHGMYPHHGNGTRRRGRGAHSFIIHRMQTAQSPEGRKKEVPPLSRRYLPHGSHMSWLALQQLSASFMPLPHKHPVANTNDLLATAPPQ